MVNFQILGQVKLENYSQTHIKLTDMTVSTDYYFDKKFTKFYTNEQSAEGGEYIYLKGFEYGETFQFFYYNIVTPTCGSVSDFFHIVNGWCYGSLDISVDSSTPIACNNILNFIQGSNITITLTDDPTNNKTDVQIDASGGGGGTVTAVTGSSPISSTGGTTPDISIAQADSGHDGYLSSTDWNTFNGKVDSVTATGLLTSSGGTTPDISSQVGKGKLVGRNSTTAGIMEEISVGSGLTLSGTTLSAPANSSITHAVASGTDTYTATITGVTSYADGDVYLIRFTNGNTTGCTLNINGLGAVTMYRNNDGALIGGDIQDGGEMLCVYNATSTIWQCIGTSPNSLISYVTNADSVTLTKGMPVYAFGGQGDRLTVKRAYNTGDSTSAQTIGLVLSASIATNQKGFIMMQGLLDGLSILPTATWADGDPVYLGSIAGTITNTKPYAPNHLVYLGFVTSASNGSAGRLYVRVQNGYELDELHNVQAQSPSNNDTIYYDSASNQWKTASLATILGYTPVTNARTISTNAPLSGGGDLSANRTLSISQSATASDGYLSSTDWNTFNGKQAALVSGTNIKTINSSSILGSGNLAVGTVTSVGGTGTTAGLSLSGSVTSSGNLTLSGTLSTPISTINDSTTVGQNLVKLVNPSAITFMRINADNTVSTLDAATFRTAIGAGTSSTNGTVTSVAALTLGTSGTDLSSTVANGTTTPVITLNVPTASATNRGVLSAADWSTFNSKIGGSGTTSYVPRFSAGSTLASGIIQDNGTNAGVNIAPSTLYKFHVSSPSTLSPQTAIRGTSASVGVDGYGSIDNGTVIGVQGLSTDNGNPFASLVCIGGKFTGLGGGNFNYSVQLQDGTEGLNKVLLSTTADGKANWSAVKTINSNSIIGSGNISVGTVTSVTGTAPVVSSGGTTPAISMAAATTSVDGYLSSTNFNTFNGKLISPWDYRKSGRWWTPSNNALSIGSLTNVANSIRFQAVIIDRDITITQLGIAVVSVAAAGNTCRIGIYSNDSTNTLPLTRLVDSGTLALDSTGTKTVTGLSVALTKGLYWFAYFSNASTGTIASVANLNMPDVIGVGASLQLGVITGYSQSLAYTSLPASAGTLTAQLSQASSFCTFYFA